MLLFNTPRLDIKTIQDVDIPDFIELLSDPKIITPVPQPIWSESEIMAKYEKLTNYSGDILLKDKVAWGVYEKGQTELIGLCALLTNEDQQREIGYRFKTKYWGRGYGTEVTQYMIQYCFETLNLEVITADVNVENIGSVKILEKFFTPVKEWFNTDDNCTDRRYSLSRSAWEAELHSTNTKHPTI